MYKDINGKTGYKQLKGLSGKTYGNLKLFNDQEKQNALEDGIIELQISNAVDRDKQLALAKENKRKSLNYERDQLDQLPIFFNGYKWDADLSSQKKLNDTITVYRSIGSLPAGFIWTSKDNIDVPVELQDLINLAEALLARGFLNHLKCRELKQKIQDADLEQLTGIQWPETLEEQATE